jgi:hypothetical protein
MVVQASTLPISFPPPDLSYTPSSSDAPPDGHDYLVCPSYLTVEVTRPQETHGTDPQLWNKAAQNLRTQSSNADDNS